LNRPKNIIPISAKTIFATVVISGLLLGAEPQSLTAAAPRIVIVIDAGAPPVIRAGVLQSTLIVLPEQEKVATVFGGDTASWIFDGGHVPSRFISIKPKVANTSTDVHIVSDHGNEYTLQLKEVSTDPDPHFDSKIFLNPGEKDAKDKLNHFPVFIPAAEADQKISEYRKQAERAKQAEDVARTAAQADEAQYRASYPAKLHFDYAWDQKLGSRVGVQQIWRDEKFTYIRGRFQEPPALYELKDGKGSLINFDFANGLYTVPKMIDQGYLSIGKQRMDFRRTGEVE
jgi:type IV secretory pathway VirB9-like protein